MQYIVKYQGTNNIKYYCGTKGDKGACGYKVSK